MSAAKTYSPEKGATFSTYAYHCAKNEILMEVRKWNGKERQLPCCFSEARWVLSSKHGGGISSEADLCLEGSDREKAELQIIDNLCSSKKRLFPKASISPDVNTALEYKDFMQNLLSYAGTLHKFLPVILRAFSLGISLRDVSKLSGYSASTAGVIWMKYLRDVQNWIADWVAKTTE